MSRPVRVGVLALQGDFAAHVRALERAAAAESLPLELSLARRPAQLKGLDGLVLPGGESTTLLKLLAQDGLDAEIVAFAARGAALLATCAGAILISRQVENPSQPGLGVLDARIERNSYGRQVDSFVGEAAPTEAGRALLGDAVLPAVFIRAPRFLETGAAVEVLATEGADPVLVRSGAVLAATFHPELTADTRVHALLLALAGAASLQRAS